MRSAMYTDAISHSVRLLRLTCMDPTHRLRTSSRILLFDERGHVLLIRFVVPRAGAEFTFWATPGGAVESGEALDHAARRELREELGIDVKVFGPVHEACSEFEHEGYRVRNTDVVFVGRFQRRDITLSGTSASEAGAMRDLRWWSAPDLERSTETFFPADLPRLMASYADIAAIVVA